MARKKKEPNRADELIDEMLEGCSSPEDILGESGLIQQLTQRVVERALAGELTHHLKSPAERGNSRNGSSKKTIQSEHGDLELSIPRDRKSSF
ncbi:MAG: transposase, partial [Cyanobacteria bacterium J06633_23]